MSSLSILTSHGLLVFIGAELIFSLSPGPTVLLISAYGLRGGMSDALAAIAGTQTANSIWYVICIAGFGALVTTSPALFHTVKLLGAAYLIWLGARALWKSRNASCAREIGLMGHPYVQAVLTQLGNPKALLFFGALVPQFLDTHAPLLSQYLTMFAIIFLGESIILSGYGALAAAGGHLSGLAYAVWRERLGGMALLALGLLAAFA
jgi:homoserine/homoserine lactone efflux protein